MGKYLHFLSVSVQEVSDKILQNDILVKLIILANLGGTLFGFYWYQDLLQSTPVYLWPLVPDSPLSTLMISISLVLYLYGRPNRVIDALAFFSNLKYGLWTVFVEFYMFESFLTVNSVPMYIFIVVSHLIMFFQAFLVLRYTRVSWRPAVFAFGFYLINDLIDYSLGIHAPLPEEIEVIGLTSGVAFMLTLAAFLYYSRDLFLEMK